MKQETYQRILNTIKRLGCRRVHIGGGEPFLNSEGLKMVVNTAREAGVAIDYVETNSSWYRDKDTTRRLLSALKASGLSSLLISISPFHNAHIPFYKVKAVIKASRDIGMHVFPWIAEFYDEVDSFDDRTVHNLSEYIDKFGPDYLMQIPSRYWVHFGGRALKTFAGVFGTRPFRDILHSSQGGCRELIDTSHFHVDLFGNYIPGLCSGIRICIDALGGTIAPDTYPFLDILFRQGIKGLFDFVSGGYSFKPRQGYFSKCDLCLDIRRYLVCDADITAAEFGPKEFYMYV
jgi:hypothetical protein